MATKEAIELAQGSLARVQLFDAHSIGRKSALGEEYHFENSIKHAEKTILLFKKIPISILADLSDTKLQDIQAQANGFYGLLDKAIKFKIGQNLNDHPNITNQLETSYNLYFDKLWQYIAFGVAKNTDTSELESNARSIIQEITDQKTILEDKINESAEQAKGIVNALKTAAAESGVTQQSIHFKEESERHRDLAKETKKELDKAILALFSFAILSILIHKIPFFKPENTIESIQLISGKALIFASIGYLLILTAKTYLSHKHNEIVNKHRQNALLTYQALAKAAGTKGTEDIILAHAASCIFSPQETGYTKSGADSSAPKGVLELLTKSSSKAE